MEKIRPGVYQFSLPYLPYPLHYTNQRDHETRTVSVEIHVGRKEDLREGKWITAIAYSTSGFSDYVETIFSNIRKFFFQEILPSSPTINRFFYEDRVRLVEVHTKSQDIHDWHELEMDWDANQQMYIHPVWKAISSYAWYFQAYQNKVQTYAQIGLNYLRLMNDQQSLLQMPLWLIQVLQKTQRLIQKEELETEALSLMSHSLKRLAGEQVKTSDYSSEVTTFFLEEFNRLKLPTVDQHYTTIKEERQTLTP